VYFVRKLSTGTYHLAESEESFKTLCGDKCKSNLVNDANNGFGTIKNIKNVLNKPKITCKKCREIWNKKM